MQQVFIALQFCKVGNLDTTSQGLLFQGFWQKVDGVQQGLHPLSPNWQGIFLQACSLVDGRVQVLVDSLTESLKSCSGCWLEAVSTPVP
jgi:hypothetical protein